MKGPIDDPEELYVIFDVNPEGWARRNEEFTVKDKEEPDKAAVQGLNILLNDVCSFLNSFLALNRQNRVVLLAASHYTQRTLWPTSDSANSQEYPFLQVVHTFKSGVKQMLEEGMKVTPNRKGTLITGALCRTLCMINRSLKIYPGRSHRIFIIQISDDCTHDYVKFMNCVFSAQKLRVLVDGLHLGDKQSVFLQQATHLTGGVLFKPNQNTEKFGLSEILFTMFLPSPALRKHIPNLEKKLVELKATCFCHQKHKEIAFVCPVCLAIYCKRAPECPTCGARLPKLLKTNWQKGRNS